MIVHAAGLSAYEVRDNTFAVVLASPDEERLVRLEQRLLLNQVPHSSFREPDQPWDGSLMSIGLHPVEDRRTIRRFLRGFSLLGGD